MRCCRVAILSLGLVSILPGQMQRFINRNLPAVRIATDEGNPVRLSVKAIAPGLVLTSDGTIWTQNNTAHVPSRVRGLAGVTALAVGLGQALAFSLFISE